MEIHISQEFIQSLGYLGYALIWAIVFAESAFLPAVVLPGDSLLVTAGVLAAQGYFDPVVLIIGCLICTILGYMVNYSTGKRWGRALFERRESWVFHKKNLERTEAFYYRYGAKTLIVARLIAVVRTFAPAVAGVVQMDYRKFMICNIIGAVIWSVGVTLVGYFFGYLFSLILSLKEFMELIWQFVDIFLHLDKHLAEIIGDYGAWTYGILFAIIFFETGVVVTPFLPGDSLLFAAGTLTATTGVMNIHVLFGLLWVAAILGDTLNYSIGYWVGPKVFERESRWIKREHLLRTQEFYQKYGGMTIIIARFVPIIRTFAPFVAGIAKMDYRRFVVYNVVGGLLWTSLLLYAGYFFGNLPFVQKNFGAVVIAIIIISVMPIAIEWLRAFFRDRAAKKQSEP